MTGEEPIPLYYDMQALLSGELPPSPQPAIGCRNDGHHIFYTDQVNLVFGDPETGKTWICLWCAANKLINDDTSRVVVIDMDHNGPTATAARLLAFGVPKEVLADPNRFRYVEPDDRLHMARVIADLTDWRPDVAVVDSLGELMPLYGANSYSGDDFTDVNARVLKPLAKAGAAVLVIDHLSKGADSRNFGPVGTAAKRRAIGGVSLRVTLKDAFTPGSGGAAYLKVNKDRHGGLREHCPTGDREPLAGTFIMRVFNDNTLTGEIKAADGTENVTDDHALSSSQTRDVAADVAVLDTLDPPPQSKRDVCQRMNWGDSRAQTALKAWRESTGRTVPKNQHEAHGGSAGTGSSTPYMSVPAVPAPQNSPEIGSDLDLSTESAGTQDERASATVTALDSRRSDESRPQSTAAWLSEWMAANAGPGGWVKPGDVLAAGMKAGHKKHAIMKAKRLYADPPIESSGRGRESHWRIIRTTDTEDAS
ncbi:hypothetical protein QYF68_23275 [Mycolicibacterium austroafricanum]|uniref:AAA family ATPase n=1 Tax=Mycolicibacterium austroafricanum TaxID=39687 RepID=A0ABT8HIZ0_MYCAO|nr:hypothetical protein [Mycolicibacterium austroafricanum]MDN4520714.1 hypothetical protein [Mycolicibacterium austroafricanum]